MRKGNSINKMDSGLDHTNITIQHGPDDISRESLNEQIIKNIKPDKPKSFNHGEIIIKFI